MSSPIVAHLTYEGNFPSARSTRPLPGITPSQEITMHFIAVSLQEENWEDDGGDHDPFVTTVTTAELGQIQAGGTLKEGDPLIKKLRAATPVQLPVQIEWIGTVWTKY
jgi:hypothetical protein